MNQMQKETLRYIRNGVLYIVATIICSIIFALLITGDANACDGDPVYPETVETPTIILSL